VLRQIDGAECRFPLGEKYKGEDLVCQELVAGGITLVDFRDRLYTIL